MEKIEEYLKNNPDNPKYLFHGSPNLYNILEPQQSHCDNNYDNNIAKAIFMYPVFYKTIPFALKKGFIKKTEFGKDSYFETFNKKLDYPYAIVNNCDIDEDAFGYVYVFKYKDNMLKDIGDYQYKCFEPLTPIDVVKVTMKEYKKLFEIRNDGYDLDIHKNK